MSDHGTVQDATVEGLDLHHNARALLDAVVAISSTSTAHGAEPDRRLRL